ncbi:MAG TPA: 4'-phosphopantetheinyl transferase superfamily protein, partial [Thermomicrobiales bacterium]|nr:4'-phosphopantetheinyl transferase superfamily protein [Thermomicrobiales bacterium]
RRFVFERDRAHFAAARGYLRAILASYAGCNPSEVRFAYGDHGKPYLDDSVCAQDLTFNLSHSRGLALYGVARGRQIGVDVEYIRSEVDILGIARTTFSPDERARLEALPHHRRLRAFYDCWTRKEAYIKARGLGLSYPLDAFDVNIEGNESALLLRSVEGQDEVDRWALHVVDAGAGYSAALAVERPVGGLRLFR